MKTSQNTVLITGGSAGIGLELAKTLIAKGNKVIITGRNKARLEKAAADLGGVPYILGDVSNANDAKALVNTIKAEYPELNIVINNAGAAELHEQFPLGNVSAIAEREIITNYLSIIRLNEQLLPVLLDKPEAAIVNVTSIVAFTPSISLPTYAASKAALHAYTVSMRQSLSTGPVKVFELMPPLVNTELSAPIGGENGIPASQVADEFVAALEKDVYEIHVGATADLYKVTFNAPQEAFKILNGLA